MKARGERVTKYPANPTLDTRRWRQTLTHNPASSFALNSRRHLSDLGLDPCQISSCKSEFQTASQKCDSGADV